MFDNGEIKIWPFQNYTQPSSYSVLVRTVGLTSLKKPVLTLLLIIQKVISYVGSWQIFFFQTSVADELQGGRFVFNMLSMTQWTSSDENFRAFWILLAVIYPNLQAPLIYYLKFFSCASIWKKELRK